MDTMQEPSKGPSSPSKGKGADTGAKTWRTGWWDFYQLLERPKRPLQWTQSSIIFSGHPTEALVTGRHFSSSKQFILPSPTEIISSPSPYDPPSVLTVSPSEKWLFAYFSRRDGEGLGCLWVRGDQIDSWTVKETLKYPRNGGVVAASWLGNHREWAAISGVPTRLPPQGPPTPVSDPTFIVVTEDNYVHVVYNRHYTNKLSTMKRSLSLGAGACLEPYRLKATNSGDNLNPLRQCVDAAIGISYNDLPMILATRSRRMPPLVHSTTITPAFDSMDLSMPIDLTMPDTVPDQKALEFDSYREEHSIDLFDLRFGFDSQIMGLKVAYTCSIDVPDPLIDLKFLSVPHTPSSSTLPAKPEKGHLFLAVSTLELDGFVRPPTSTLSIYSTTPFKSPAKPFSSWEINQLCTRTFDEGVLTHFDPFITSSSDPTLSLYATVLHHSGTLPASSGDPSSHSKHSNIGATSVLNLQDLTTRIDFDPAPVMSLTSSVGRDLPLYSVISPHKKLISMHSYPVGGGKMTLHGLPKQVTPENTSHLDPLALSVAVIGGTSAADIVHHICSPKVPLSHAIDTIHQTIEILEKYSSPVPHSSTWSIIGIAVDVYRARFLQFKDGQESELLQDRWQTGHDICSIAACNIAFEDCKEDAGYDLDVAWEIVSMCTWLVHFTEKLMRQCVVWNSAVNDITPDRSIAPVLLHLSHPYALQNLCVALKHVQAFKNFVTSLPAGSVEARLAQTLLIDTISCSGIDFVGLIAIVEESMGPVKNFEADVSRRALASLQPQPTMQQHLAQLLNRILESPTILNKSTLFLKPSDLSKGMTRLSLAKYRTDEKDVVTKGALMHGEPHEMCLRCGGRSKIVKRDLQSKVSPRWRVWQNMWQLRCICGGSWFSAIRT